MNDLLHAVSRCSPVYALLFGILSCCLLPLKRDRLALRVCVSAGGFFLLSLLILLIPEGSPHAAALETLYYYLLYLAGGAGLLLCFEGSIYEVAYVCVIGQVWQHTLYTLTEIVFLTARLAGRPIPAESPAVTIVVFALYAAAYLLMFGPLKRCFRRLIPLRGFTEVLAAGLLLPLPLTVLNLAIMQLTDAPAVLLAYRIHMLLTCVIMYLLLLSIQHTRLVVQESQRVREAAQKQKEQYEFKREVIERVNIRAHDLKKLLDRMEGSGRGPDPGMTAQIRSELERYDRLVETGNEALDTVLSDAVLRSEQEKVRFTYLLDGKALSFVQPIDLYAIFGNLLDNAFTAVASIPESERRIVSIKMTDAGDCLFFHVLNTCSSVPILENGLPRTTKPDAENHGFGTKSVCASVARYGGELVISAEEGLFHANFFLKKPT